MRAASFAPLVAALAALAVAALAGAPPARAGGRSAPDAAPAPPPACAPEEAACAPAPDATTPGPWGGGASPPAGRASGPSAAAPRDAPERLVVYWGIGCPRCEEARPAIEALRREVPGLEVEWVEVRADPVGRARFDADVARLGLAAPGIPTFVAAGRAVVGFRGRASEAELRALAAAALGAGTEGLRAPPATSVDLPGLGVVDAARMPLAAFTVAVALVDGVNPCAMYVLVVLLGILLHVRSRARVALYGAVFVAASGLVYVLFMTAWLGLFALGGLSRTLTVALGAALLAMGLLNLKDAVWLKRGPSLSVPDRARPGLHRRMREIASAASAPAGLAGVAALAVVVNLVELGCTLGLPAVFTRVLSLRTELGAGGRAAYLALYGLVYVVPLAAVVAVFAATMRRLVLTEGRARALKGISGTLLLLFGLVFLLRPGLLG